MVGEISLDSDEMLAVSKRYSLHLETDEGLFLRR